ncbi:histidine kinase dimerization/phosphoacceptor domain -containing protein [Desulfocurvibacter africanus]|uniref:Signal transduction histidine kinase n=1 Tax=Desulfocurvibacter africanus subsp. africanus str. Walvis Bay TaxID=690850 RepID=F3YUL4_DESAF|nr:histidine kinase dimerization/phosphoacceptor domain -containing protein [Desulfocurvibacter africanus]EGJ48968.1 signal transduction histidine kinase [Desulfocurvibacter africanus subsp. africanus str. Walvis Bay]
MRKPYDQESERLRQLQARPDTRLREKLIGLGETSMRKSYYPELKERMEDLERFRALLDQVSDAILLVNLETLRIADANGAAGDLLGRARDSLLGLRLDKLMPPETTQAMDDFLCSGQVESFVESTLPAAGGRMHDAPVEIVLRVVPFGSVPYMVAVARDVSERKLNEERLRDSLREKEVLLKEIHHRVKNNLQTISSLLSLQAQVLDDPAVAELFRESQNRIQSMALVHERLYQADDLSSVDFDSYLSSVISFLMQSYRRNSSSVRLIKDLEDLALPVTVAIPCGLMVNELLSNSLKYAFPDGRAGAIEVSFRRDGDRYVLRVADDGVGLPPDIDPLDTSSLGLKLVLTLVRQLKGNLDIQPAPGASFHIAFPCEQGKTSR